MFSFLFEIILPAVIIIPIAIGFTLSLPILIIYPLFVRFRLRPQTRAGIAVSVGLISTLIVMSLYAWLLISMEYKFPSPASQDPEIRQTYEKEAILEAWRHSIIPPPFQKSCYSGEAIVCQIAERYPLGIWDWQINSEDSPGLPGMIAGITSAMMVRRIFSSITREINSASVHATP
jgi:hypothetical protein